jgi:hypothetical protein
MTLLMVDLLVIVELAQAHDDLLKDLLPEEGPLATAKEADVRQGLIVLPFREFPWLDGSPST